MTKIKSFLIFSILFSQCLFPVYAEMKTLNFGIYGSERRSWIDEHNVPLLQHIKKQLNIKHKQKIDINTVFFASYTEAVDALINKKIDFARLGAASYLSAKRESPLTSIIAVESFKGKQFHEGVIAVLKDSPIKSIKDLKDKSFAFGNKSSTIGRYLSQQFLLDNGISAADLKTHEYMGRHDNVAIAIIRRTHDAGAFKIGILKDERFNKRLRILDHFQAPAQVWVSRAGFDENLLSNLKDVFFNIPKEVINIKNRDAFVQGNLSNFEYLRNSIDNNDLFFSKKQ